MKKGWEVKTLGDVCDIYNGSTPLRKVKEFWENGTIPWFTISDIRKQGRIITQTEQKISESAFNSTSIKLLPKDSVLICCTASVGEFAITKIELTTNQQFNGLVINNVSKLIPMFLFYFMSTVKSDLLDVSGKTTIDFVSMKKLRKLEIPLPPLPEQKRIVAILDKAFSAIDQAKANTEQNLQNTKEVFESYLQSVFENRGEDWEESELNKYVNFIDYRGRTPKKTDSGIRLITAKNIKKGFIQIHPEEFIAAEDYDSWMTRGIPNYGDVLFTTEAPLANVAQLNTNEKVAFAQRTIVFQPDKKVIDQTFLKYLLLSNPIQKLIISQGTGATVKGIKSRLLKKIPISYPSITKQKLFVQKLDLLSTETQKLQAIYEQKLVDLAELKKSILQKAFNGELT